MGHAYANYFSKTHIVCYTKMQKKITVLFPGKTPLKLKNTPKTNNFNPVPAAGTAGPCSTTMCRRSDNSVDPNQTGS